MRRFAWPVALIGVVIILGGCARTTSTQRFVPKPDAARQVLTLALTAWKEGKPMGLVGGYEIPIEVVDSKWKEGQKLASFEIGAEDTNADGHRLFTVKLTMQAGGAVQQVKYVVLGQNPLWVYREEDYRKLSGA